jgi:hypothetical protein
MFTEHSVEQNHSNLFLDYFLNKVGTVCPPYPNSRKQPEPNLVSKLNLKNFVSSKKKLCFVTARRL